MLSGVRDQRETEILVSTLQGKGLGSSHSLGQAVQPQAGFLWVVGICATIVGFPFCFRAIRNEQGFIQRKPGKETTTLEERERGDESLGPASGSHPLSCNSFIIVQSVNKIPTG